MDLRGQYYKLHWSQKYKLIRFAREKNWKLYWMWKRIYLLKYEEWMQRKQSQSQTASERYILELEKMKKEQTQS